MFQTCELWQSALWFCSSKVIFELTDRHCDILNFQASTHRHRSRSWTTSSSPSSTASSSSTGGSHSRYVCHPLFSSERPVSSESSYTENVQWRKEPLDSSVLAICGFSSTWPALLCSILTSEWSCLDCPLSYTVDWSLQPTVFDVSYLIAYM